LRIDVIVVLLNRFAFLANLGVGFFWLSSKPIFEHVHRVIGKAQNMTHQPDFLTQNNLTLPAINGQHRKTNSSTCISGAVVRSKFHFGKTDKSKLV